MLLKTITALLLGTSPLLSAAYPANTPSTDVVAAKAHNIYLVTCVPKARKSDSDDNDKDDPSTPSTNFTAVAYFKQPLNASDSDNAVAASADKAPKPDKSALVSAPPEPWEGIKWKVKVWKDKVFSASIAADAQTLAKGGIAGDVKLDEEQYVCFRDGETAIRIRDDGVRGNCVADYWCAGLDTGKGDGDAL